MGDFEAQFLETTVPDDVEDVTTLDAASLLRRHAAVERELRELRELYHPRTDAGRKLHSCRSAYLLELRNRHLM